MSLAAVPVAGIAWARNTTAAITEVLLGSQAVVHRIDALLDVIESLVLEIGATNVRAGDVVTRADALTAESSVLLLQAQDQASRSAALLHQVEAYAIAAHPTVSHTAEVLRPEHVDRLVQLLDLVPQLLDLIVPAFRGLGDLSPELEQLTERFDTIGQIVEGLPGAGILKRRGGDDSDD